MYDKIKKLIFYFITLTILFFIIFLPIELFYRFKNKKLKTETSNNSENYNFWLDKYPNANLNVFSLIPGDYNRATENFSY